MISFAANIHQFKVICWPWTDKWFLGYLLHLCLLYVYVAASLYVNSEKSFLWLYYPSSLFSELILKNEIKKITLYKANSVGIYLLKVINRNTGTRCKICSKLAIKTPEQRHWRHSGVFIDNFEHISYPVLVFLLLTLNT